MTISFRAPSMNWGETIVWRTAEFFARLATWLKQEVRTSLALRRQLAFKDAIEEYEGRAKYWRGASSTEH